MLKPAFTSPRCPRARHQRERATRIPNAMELHRALDANHYHGHHHNNNDGYYNCNHHYNHYNYYHYNCNHYNYNHYNYCNNNDYNHYDNYNCGHDDHCPDEHDGNCLCHTGGKTVGRVCAVTGPMWQDLSKARNKPPICWWFIPAIYGKIEDGFPTLSHIPKSNELASCFLLNLLFGEYTVYPIFTYTQVVCVDPGTMGIFRDAKDADSLGNLSPVCTSGSLLQGCWVLLGRTGGRATLEG